MKKYKHIIWDWNGTLLNDRWLCVEAINQSLDKRSIPTITEEKYKDVFSFPVEDYYRKVGFDFVKEPFHIAGDEFVSYYGENFHRVSLHSDSILVLNEIKKSGLSQSVLSAGRQDFLIDWIYNHDLSNFFTMVLGIGNQYATGKIELGMSCIKKIPYESHDVMMVGDTNHDSDVAEAMGIECVLVENGHMNRKRLEKTGRKVVSDLNEFMRILI